MFFSRQVAAKPAFVKLALAIVAAIGLAASAHFSTQARDDKLPASAALGVVDLSTLPPQAEQTYRLIRSGGPFPFDKDGTVFQNRERLLPQYPRGHYREYTVKTPGARDRGARRIVCGGTPPTAPAACFYTADHYASFRLIAP